MQVRPGDTIVVWFSCGAASAIAAKKTIEKYGKICKIRVVNNPVKEEDPDNQRFLKDIEEWLGLPIESATNRDYPECSAEQIWEKRKYMAGVAGAPCTMLLKKHARQQWEKNNKTDWHVLGFTAEEERRYNRFILTERDNVLPILIEAGITKQACFQIIQEAGIKLPEVYLMGYPNANCIGCVKAASPTYWNHVRKLHPEVFNSRAEMSRRFGVKLVKYKGTRIFLDELPIDAKGRSMRGLDFECGIFCEERE